MPWGDYPQPPAQPPGELVEELIAAGTLLYRVYTDGYRVTQFNPTPRGKIGGARFDCTDDEIFGALYVGSGEECAVAETLLRDVSGPAPHGIHEDKLEDRRLGCLVPLRTLRLVSLRGAGLYGVAPARQWLTTCVPKYYEATRSWGSALRKWAPWADGFSWRARHENDQLASVFFEDRCTEDQLEARPHPFLGALGPEGDRIDRGVGLQHLKGILDRYQAEIQG